MIQHELPHFPHNNLLLSFLPATCNKPYHLLPSLKTSTSAKRSRGFVTPERIMVVASTQRLPGFLRIPPEIREQIYSDLFHDQPSSLPALLTVHPRILGEIRPWIFKLPITFNGQQSLLEWLSDVGPGFLPHVGHIRFKLHDIDPEKIVGALGERLRRARIQDSAYYIGNPYEEACATELYHIKTSLQKLKNLRSLTIIESTSADPKPPPNMMKTFLALILTDLPLHWHGPVKSVQDHPTFDNLMGKSSVFAESYYVSV
ncbi:MAG: hypothetical protein Q9181_005606 [Wetmoreana brouardii]